jgi:hypothetical protein
MIRYWCRVTYLKMGSAGNEVITAWQKQNKTLRREHWENKHRPKIAALAP